MTKEKFIYDSETLIKFIHFYCDNKHKNDEKKDGAINLNYNYKNLNQELHYHLCKECEHTLLYSYEKLQECPFVDKPSCRKCNEPCYERDEWKKSAKIMKYSGLKLGFTKIKQLFKLRE